MSTQSIKLKLIRIILSVSLVVLVVSSCCYLVWQSLVVKYNLQRTLTVQAAITAENCNAALVFEDKDEAANVLKSLSHDSNIVRCELYDSLNSIFASYPETLENGFDKSEYCVVDYVIEMENEYMGHLTIYGSYSQFYSTLYYGAIITVVMMLVCFALAYVLGNRLQRAISGPVLTLKETTSQISQSQDYSTRIQKISEDELGDLAEEFNEMLEQIQARDLELKDYNKQLEEKVEERTKELEASMVKAQRLAENAQVANQAKSEFLANMSHELRTPMNAIIGFTSVMLSEEMDEQHKQYMKTIDTSARSLLNIINDILDFSKIEAGRLDIESVVYSVPHVLEEIRSEMNPSAVEKGIDLSVTSDGNLPDNHVGDPLRIKQCLINLIGNAIKFTSEGSVSVNVSMVADGDNNSIVFKIADTGIGIPESKLKLIFGSFSQADGSTSRKYGGTGLGLTITRNLVKLMGGQILVDSQEGVGSTFTVTLPTKYIVNKGNGTGSVGVNKASELGLDGIFNGCKILVAEDNASNQELIRTFLKPTGAEFDIAENGLEAIKLWLADKDYDIILMDMQMPVMSGYDAAKELRKVGCEIPILAVTANAMQKDKDDCLEAGCDCHVPKPLERDVFIEIVKQYLHKIKVGSN